MKVYVITEGEYSDYHICAVTDDPVSAENLRAYYTTSPYSYVEIEEYETQSLPEKPKTCWYCRYPINYPIECTEVRYISEEDAQGWGGETKINDVTYSRYDNCFFVYVFAKDKAHALKIAAEKIYQYKYQAESVGKDPWNKPEDSFFVPNLASATVSDDIVQQLKEGKPITDEFTMAFYKGDES